MSSNKAKKDHIHKYYQAIKPGYKTLWACASPDCSHYKPANTAHLLEGKFSICWGCDNPMRLDEKALSMERPECLNCKTGIKADELNEDDVHTKFLKMLEERDKGTH